MLLLVALIGVCAGWMADRGNWQSERAQLKESNTVRDAQLFGGIFTFASTSRSDQIFFELSELGGGLSRVCRNATCQ